MILDVVIVGGGIIGLACARELTNRHPHLRLAVLEKELQIARHQSARNSGVIHSGVYYKPGSLKARLCVEGSAAIYAYCSKKGIAAERCGKVIVAHSEDELPRLHQLFEQGIANGVEGVQLIDADRLRELEPFCIGSGALLVPGTGITDYSKVSAAYGEDVLQAGAEIHCGSRLTSIAYRNGFAALRTAEGVEVKARQAICCAGLQSDLVARLSGGARYPAVVPFRGDYWLLRRPELARNLIYPVPDPRFPFLGVHFTRRVDGGPTWVGPNAVLALAREGYSRFAFQPRTLGRTLADPGFRQFARKHWRTGADELVRAFSVGRLVRELQKYVPAVTPGDIMRGPSGVRAQAIERDGSLVDDFVFDDSVDRILHVRNAPSPGATSSLAIGRVIADRADTLAGR